MPVLGKVLPVLEDKCSSSISGLSLRGVMLLSAA